MFCKSTSGGGGHGARMTVLVVVVVPGWDGKWDFTFNGGKEGGGLLCDVG